MKRNFATFGSERPDDTEWGAHGEVLAPGGRAVLDLLRCELIRRNWGCTSIRPHSFYGWSFFVETKPKPSRLLIQVHADEAWLLMVTAQTTFLNWLRSQLNHNVDPRLLTALADILGTPTTFRACRWWSEAELRLHGREESLARQAAADRPAAEPRGR